MLFGSTTDSISATAGRRAIQINSSQHYLWRAVDQGGEVVDVLLPLLLEQHLSAVLPRTPGCLVAGRPGSQVLDISHAVQCVLEKGLDDFGVAAAAQCDIQQFYDSLPLILILLWLVGKGVPSPLVAAAIRHQVCPQVTLVAGAARAVILDRCVGGLT